MTPSLHTWVTVISAWVSVPVLSVQMTVVEPSASTASSRLTSARRRAMRRTPMASDTDSVAGSPSGTSATITPSANTNADTSGWPVCSRRANRAAPIATASADTRRAMTATSRCNGVFVRGAWSASRKIRPNSVTAPVAYTTALPAPDITVVPMNTQLRESSAVTAAVGSPTRPTAELSPVSGALFTERPCASTTRQSADTASPASRTTRSPGTSAADGSSTRSPSRSTRQTCGTIAWSVCAVRSAEYSWAKPITAFSTTTPRMANASWRLPASWGCWSP